VRQCLARASEVFESIEVHSSYNTLNLDNEPARLALESSKWSPKFSYLAGPLQIWKLINTIYTPQSPQW